jgi:hypothetical protein
MNQRVRAFYSPLSGRFFAIPKEGRPFVRLTDPKHDVTDEIGDAVTTHGITFHAVPPKKQTPRRRTTTRRRSA